MEAARARTENLQLGEGVPSPGRWTAIVLAGRRPGIDPLAQHFTVEYKALIDADGEPMLGRVVRSLTLCPEVGRVIVLAQDIDAIMSDPRLAWLGDHSSILGLASGDGISRSIQTAIAQQVRRWPVLVTTADNVLLTPEILSHFIEEAACCDVAVAMVARSRLLRSYPSAARSWLKFRDEAYTGANLFALNSRATMRALELWEQVERDRKSLLRVAARFGPWLLLRVVLRSLSVQDAILRAGLRLGLFARPVILPFADAGIDVDKMADHMLAETILRARRVETAQMP